MFIPKLAESESYVKGRSPKTAEALIEAVGAENVRTTSHGYVITGEAPEGLEVYTAADRPAVPTEPGTSTNVEEVNNVGQAATAVAEAKTDEAEAAANGEEQSIPETPGDDNVPNPDTESSESTEDKDAEEKVEQFDPSKATVDEVKEYLDGADATERERVLAAEAAGKGRKTILELAEAPEGAK